MLSFGRFNGGGRTYWIRTSDQQIKSPLIKESPILHGGKSDTSVKTGRFTGIYVGILNGSA